MVLNPGYVLKPPEQPSRWPAPRSHVQLFWFNWSQSLVLPVVLSKSSLGDSVLHLGMRLASTQFQHKQGLNQGGDRGKGGELFGMRCLWD